MHTLAHYDSPIGRLLLAADETALIGCWFEGQKYYAAGLDENAAEGDSPILEQAAAWLDAYFAGRRPGRTPPLRFELECTPFRMNVWQALLMCSYGTATTYGHLAKMCRGANARSVGGAVSRNPISIFVPCHRVLGADGSLTGYAGGPERKRFLLELEGVLPAKKK